MRRIWFIVFALVLSSTIVKFPKVKAPTGIDLAVVGTGFTNSPWGLIGADRRTYEVNVTNLGTTVASGFHVGWSASLGGTTFLISDEPLTNPLPPGSSAVYYPPAGAIPADKSPGDYTIRGWVSIYGGDDNPANDVMTLGQVRFEKADIRITNLSFAGLEYFIWLDYYVDVTIVNVGSIKVRGAGKAWYLDPDAPYWRAGGSAWDAYISEYTLNPGEIITQRVDFRFEGLSYEEINRTYGGYDGWTTVWATAGMWWIYYPDGGFWRSIGVLDYPGTLEWDANPGDNTMSSQSGGLGSTGGGSVGGVVVSTDRFGLLAPYIGLASTIIVATVAAAIHIKHGRQRKEKLKRQ